MHPYVHSSIIYNSQDMEATKVCPLMDKWMKKVWYTYILIFYKYIQWNITQPLKNKILSFVPTWLDVEGILPSEINYRKTNTVWFHLYVESKNKRNEQT